MAFCSSFPFEIVLFPENIDFPLSAIMFSDVTLNIAPPASPALLPINELFFISPIVPLLFIAPPTL